jgi:sorbitol/mannitol transport system permease protein
VTIADRPTATQVPGRAPGAPRRRRENPWSRRLPLLPALVFTVVVTQVPFLFSLYYSLTDWKVVPPTPQTFVGIANYLEGYTNGFFLEAVGTSVVMTVSAVLGSLVVGTALALLLDRSFPGRGIVRTLLITPFLVMPVVAGLVWTNQMFSTQFGVLNWILTGVGLDAVSFVQQAPTWSIVTVLVWQWAPFMMLIVLAGLQGQPTDVLEAARVDGAGGFGIFRWITLPLLRPYLELGILLGSIYLIQVFDHVEVITGGGPGSTNVPFFVYQRSIGGGWEFGLASAYAIIVVLASIVIANFALRLLSGLISKEASA